MAHVRQSVIVAVMGAIVLSGCSTGVSNRPTTNLTDSASPSSRVSAEQHPVASSPVPDAGTQRQDCTTDGSEQTAAGIATLARDSDYTWKQIDSNFDSCANLSYTAVQLDSGMAHSSHQLLLFHRGQFVGTGIKCDVPIQQIVAATDDSVSVEYPYIIGDGDGLADPHGHATVKFVWTGSKVQMNGTLPKEVTGDGC